MNAQHTPGPWIYAFTEGNMPFADIWTIDKHCTGPGHETEHRLHLATVYTDGADDANARLIASAPELLAALERLFASDSIHTATSAASIAAVAAARAAIARATGAPQ